MLSALRQLIVGFLLLFVILIYLLSCALPIGGLVYLTYLFFFASNRSWEFFGYAYGAILLGPPLHSFGTFFKGILISILGRDDQKP